MDPLTAVSRRKDQLGPRRRRQRGVALLFVLWWLLLLAALTNTISTATRTEALIVRNVIDAAEAEAFAEAGVSRAILGLLPIEGSIFVPDGTIYTWQFEGADIRFVVEDEGGKVDLNAASEDLLTRLFDAAGVGAREAAAIAAAIADYRDADDDRRANGAEAGDYLAAGLPYRPKNGPFILVDEVAQVPGMVPGLFNRVRPALTVHTNAPEPVAGVAPELVQQALGWSDIDGTGRSGQRPGSGRNLREPRTTVPVERAGETGSEPPLTLSGTNVFGLHVEARTPTGAVFARDAVVAIDRGTLPPYTILLWRRGERRLFQDDHEPPSR